MKGKVRKQAKKTRDGGEREENADVGNTDGGEHSAGGEDGVLRHHATQRGRCHCDRASSSDASEALAGPGVWVSRELGAPVVPCASTNEIPLG